MTNTRLIFRIIKGIIVDRGDITESAVKIHSKRSCRVCHERGWQYFSLLDGTAEIRTCPCVERNLSKALSSERHKVYTVTGPRSISTVYYSDTSKCFNEVTVAKRS